MRTRLRPCETWYRALGFENLHFLGDLRGVPGIHICGGIFSGICDSGIAQLLRKDLAPRPDHKPQFYYWVTLNSHLPIQVSHTSPSFLACSSPQAANSDKDVCLWMALIGELNRAIAELSVAPELPPTEFIIAGDHAPPFLATKARRQFSQTLVPFIHLIPKSRLAENEPVAALAAN